MITPSFMQASIFRLWIASFTICDPWDLVHISHRMVGVGRDLEVHNNFSGQPVSEPHKPHSE